MGIHTNIHMAINPTPEQKRALDVLEKHLPFWNRYFMDVNVNGILPTDFVMFSLEPFQNLPHEPHWVWNQSNAKIAVHLDPTTHVIETPTKSLLRIKSGSTQ